MRLDRILMIAGAVVATACGGTSDGPPSAASMIQAYRVLGQEMVNAVASYRAEAVTTPDDAACETARERYRARMEEHVGRMHELSADVDRRAGEGHQGCMGDAACAGDALCVAEAIAAEFERHVAAGCTVYRSVVHSDTLPPMS